MAIRTNAAAVKKIIEVDDTAVPDLDPFIEVASMLVDEIITTVEGGYTSPQAELIERWLAAHFYAVRDNRIDTEKAGPVSQKNQFRVGLNLNVTIYGQQAMVIDFKGGLAIINKKAEQGLRTTIGLLWAGTEPDNSVINI